MDELAELTRLARVIDETYERVEVIRDTADALLKRIKPTKGRVEQAEVASLSSNTRAAQLERSAAE